VATTPRTEADEQQPVRLVFEGRYHIENRKYQSGDQIVCDLVGDAPGSLWGWIQAAVCVPPASGLIEAANALGCIIDELRECCISPNDRKRWMGLLCRVVTVQYQIVCSALIPAVSQREAQAIEWGLQTSIKNLLQRLHDTSATIQMSIDDAITPLELAAECARSLGARADEIIINSALSGSDLPIVWHPLSPEVVSSTHNEADVLLALAFAIDSDGLALDPTTIEVGCCGGAVVALRGIAL
jgi:hypothetical protein